MTSIPKPAVRHPSLPKNSLGLTKRDYEGAMSTLCAGCGHDSITAALIQALWELEVPPHRAAKMSGIGCSSKTTAYFLKQSHENNGVYGLTKGQFSASSDVGSKSKKGEPNLQPPIDPVLLALTLGATFVARSFSGDKAQLTPILKAAMKHDGFALVDVISPCVSFNDHETSTKSYRYTRDHYHEIAPVDL